MKDLITREILPYDKRPFLIVLFVKWKLKFCLHDIFSQTMHVCKYQCSVFVSYDKLMKFNVHGNNCSTGNWKNFVKKPLIKKVLQKYRMHQRKIM